MRPSRIIHKREGDSANRFDFPAVASTAADALRGAAEGGAHLLTAGQLDNLQRQAHQEARERGHAEGLAAGKAELAARLERLAALTFALTQPFQALEQAVEDEVVALAVTLASHLVRREIERDPSVLQAAIHDCLAVLATSVRDVTLYLHPDDAKLLRDPAAATDTQGCKIATDAELARGDLRVVSSSSLIDGSIAARCAEIIAAARAADAKEDYSP